MKNKIMLDPLDPPPDLKGSVFYGLESWIGVMGWSTGVHSWTETLEGNFEEQQKTSDKANKIRRYFLMGVTVLAYHPLLKQID